MDSQIDSQLPPAFTPGDYNVDISQEVNLPNYSALTEPDLWARFFKVVDASLQMADAKMRLVLLEYKLERQSKELKKHHENTSKLFQNLHQRSALGSVQLPFGVLRRTSSWESKKKNKQREEFEASHRLESQLQEEVNELEREKRELQAKVDTNTSVACEMDQMFELVAGHAAAILSNDDPRVRLAEENLAARVSSYNKTEETANNLRRACLTVQHAHRYYNDALQNLDSVRSGVGGRIVFAGVSEMSKNQQYQVATVTAGKAQICFNETIRVLTPHTAMMPGEVLSDFEQLQELGLLQATKIYRMMYGRTNTGETNGSMKLMLQKQDTAFACLTRFAVWVQDQVPIVECQVQSSCLKKIAAQTKLVQLWKELCTS